MMKLLLIFCLSALPVLVTACSGASEKKADGSVATANAADNAAAGTASEPIMSEAAHEVYTKKCSSCHGPDGRGIASLGSDMRRAPKRSMEDWQKFLRNPQSVAPNSRMVAPVGLSDDEIAAMAAYLADLTQYNQPPAN